MSGVDTITVAGLSSGTWTVSATTGSYGGAFATFDVPGDGSVTSIPGLFLQPTDSIAGLVVMADTLQPVANTAGSLWSQNCDGPDQCVVAAASTVSDGRFLIPGLPNRAAYWLLALDPATNRGADGGNLQMFAEGQPGFGSTCKREHDILVGLVQPLTVAARVLPADGGAAGGAAVQLRSRAIAMSGGAISAAERE